MHATVLIVSRSNFSNQIYLFYQLPLNNVRQLVQCRIDIQRLRVEGTSEVELDGSELHGQAML